MQRKVFILSDSTGDTAEKVVAAAMRQFDSPGVSIEVFPKVRSEEDIEDIIERAADLDALLVHTIVSPDHRELLQRLCEDTGVAHVDLLGPLVCQLQRLLERDALEEPGGLHKVNTEYFLRIEAVDFAVKNDDGQHPRNLRKADIVLVGISRTSKTPLSTYLARRGHKVANVPIVMGIEPPKALFDIDQSKIFALDILPQALFRIRQARLQSLGMPPDTAYGMREHIAAEIEYASQLYRSNADWPVLDVTDKAIEETAAEILDIMGRRAKNL